MKRPARASPATIVWLIAVATTGCGAHEEAAPPREANTPARPAQATSAEAPRPAPADATAAAPAPSPPVPPPGPPVAPPELASATPCDDSADLAIFRSPRFPHPGQPLRVMVVSETAQPGTTLAILGPDGAAVTTAIRRGGGPPFWWSAQIERPRVGQYRVGIGAGPDVRACEAIRVGTGPVRPTMDEGIWPSAFKWERDTENFYAAWVEHLFDAGVDETVGWRPLHQVLRDPARNFLYDHLSLDEDDAGRRPPLVIAPDCADTPYTLRGYFAWKMQLPFGFRACDRGSATRPPGCGTWSSNQEAPAVEGTNPVVQFAEFLRRRVFWTVHSGSGRTLPDDQETDLYPVALTREALRPGTVFADPYGHFLVLAKWVDQTPEHSGILFAIDGQPDGSIGRKRFWRGNFLFHTDLTIAGAGWKAFRPIALRAGELRPLTNREIAADPSYGNFSDEQYRLGIDGFYDRMERLLNPRPVDPARALQDVVDALHEQLQGRVRSVQNGEDYMATASGVVSMPTGASIFETTGAWEDYATPSRDMRVLIAMQVLLDFPDKIVRQPDFFAMPAGKSPPQVRAEIVALRDRLTRERSVEYKRSDGSTFTLRLDELLTRRQALEMAYNPNDCVEHRWAAPAGSPERSTCRRQAPADQVARMASYRTWFAQRTRPPRP